MFLEGVIIVWPAIYGTIIGAISLGLILYFMRLRIKKKAVLFIKKKIILKLLNYLIRLKKVEYYPK